MAAADLAYDVAKAQILDGRFGGGDMVSEGEIAVGVGIQHRELVAALDEPTPDPAVRIIERHLSGTLELLRAEPVLSLEDLAP